MFWEGGCRLHLHPSASKSAGLAPAACAGLALLRLPQTFVLTCARAPRCSKKTFTACVAPGHGNRADSDPELSML